MPHFEHVDHRYPADKSGFGNRAHVPCKEQGKGAICQTHDQGIFVSFEITCRPFPTRMLDRQHHGIHDKSVARPQGLPIRSRFVNRGEMFEVECTTDRTPRLHYQSRSHARYDRRDPAEMVGVSVRDQHEVYSMSPLPSQKRQHYRTTSIVTPGPRPAVHNNPAPVGSVDGDRVTLPHVENMDLKPRPRVTGQPHGCHKPTPDDGYRAG